MLPNSAKSSRSLDGNASSIRADRDRLVTTPELVAFFSGQWIPAQQLRIPATDSGFMLGITVAEQMRTFDGRLFQVDPHLQRLEHSLSIVGVAPPYPLTQLKQLAEELVERNRTILPAGDDWGLSLFVTPGPYSSFHPEGGPPLVGMHTYPLAFRLWADKYDQGQALMVTDVTQVPPTCWPPELKCRSRMHYHLADRRAHQLDPGSRALLLDTAGFVSEASTANVVIYRSDQGVISPPSDSILPGISMAVLRDLADQAGISFGERPLRTEDVMEADEVWLTSTSPCLIPVTRCNREPIGAGQPGPIYRRLLDAWSQMVGVDIRSQAIHFACRPAR
jgi:branched-chain amino acid aminotransferase